VSEAATDQPLVSTVLIFLNAERFIEEAIASFGGTSVVISELATTSRGFDGVLPDRACPGLDRICVPIIALEVYNADPWT
jgi:hypothetical protein